MAAGATPQRSTRRSSAPLTTSTPHPSATSSRTIGAAAFALIAYATRGRSAAGEADARREGAWPAGPRLRLERGARGAHRRRDGRRALQLLSRHARGARRSTRAPPRRERSEEEADRRVDRSLRAEDPDR